MSARILALFVLLIVTVSVAGQVEPQSGNKVLRISSLASGSISGNVYTNEDLGLTYWFPEKWHVVDQSTQEQIVAKGHSLGYGDSPEAAQEHEKAEQCSKRLLWVSKEPPTERRPTMSPVIMLAAFDPDCDKTFKLPESIDDQAAIKQFANDVSKVLGAIASGRVSRSIEAFMLQGRPTFAVTNNVEVPVPGQKKPVSVFTTAMVTQSRGYVLLWTFMAGTKGEMENLMKTRVAFVEDGSTDSVSKAPR